MSAPLAPGSSSEVIEQRLDDGVRGRDRRIERHERLERRPDAGPAERVVGSVAVAGGERSATSRCSPRRGAGPRSRSALARRFAGRADGLSSGPYASESPGARLERQVVHRLLGVLVRLDAGREAGEIDPRARRSSDRRVEVEVRRQASRGCSRRGRAPSPRRTARPRSASRRRRACARARRTRVSRDHGNRRSRDGRTTPS